MIFKRYLILNSNGDGRVISRQPSRLRTNEVAFRLNVVVPDGWARLAGQKIEVELPPPPEITDIQIDAVEET